MTFVSLERASPPVLKAQSGRVHCGYAIYPPAFGTAQDTVRYEAESLTGLHLGREVLVALSGDLFCERLRGSLIE